jgi:hypothetical protein
MQMHAWASIRETEVVIDRTRVVGLRELDEREGPRAAVALEGAVRDDLNRPDAVIERWWRGGPPSSCRKFTVNARPRNAHVVLEGSAVGCEFLGANLTIDVLKQEFGPPESTLRRIMPGGDDRTELWVLYSYGGGAVMFVESNYSARTNSGRRQIDRAVLNSPMITRMMEAQRR